MKHPLKKAAAFLLAAVLLVQGLPLSAFAAQTSQGFSPGKELFEGEEGQTGQLEALQPQGDAHDGHAVHQADGHGAEKQLPAEQQDPHHIHQAGAGAAPALDFFAEGGQHQARDFEALHPEGDPDDSDAAQEAGERPHNAQNQAAEQQPKNISKYVHR